MPPSFTRWIRTRGILAVLAAALVRCAPDITPCVALPGASITITARPTAIAGPRTFEKVYAVALRGRAALSAALRSPAP